MAYLKVKGKLLKGYYNHYADISPNPYNNPTDSSGNPIGQGDSILYCPGTKYSDSYITDIVLETIEGTTTQVHCIKVKNGQYRTLLHMECYLVTPDFKRLHSKRVITP